MPARVVLVHDDPEFVAQAAAAVRNAGFTVAAFPDQVVAATALERMRTINLLITRMRYEPGKPHGTNSAQMAQKRRPGLKVLFMALPEYAEQAAELGSSYSCRWRCRILWKPSDACWCPTSRKRSRPPFKGRQ